MSSKYTIKKTKTSQLITIPEIQDEGKLSFVEAKRHLPFSLKRLYLIYDVANDAVRGKHAHKKTDQIMFCLKGSIIVSLDNGTTQETIKLNKANQGILLPRHLWHEMKNFTQDTILLVAASEYFKEEDYIRDYGKFLSYVNKRSLSTFFQSRISTILSSSKFKVQSAK